MGKRYYCDYCDKTMDSSPSIVKKHNKGLIHQKLVCDHYHQYKDPEQILLEELSKRFCNRFLKGECNFGSMCRFSHYTEEAKLKLRMLVYTKNNMMSRQPLFQDLYKTLQREKINSQRDAENNIIYDSNGVMYTLPWKYNSSFENIMNLPPSLKKIDLNDFINAEINDWG